MNHLQIIVNIYGENTNMAKPMLTLICMKIVKPILTIPIILIKN